MRFLNKFVWNNLWYYLLILIAFSFPFGRHVTQWFLLPWLVISIAQYFYYIRPSKKISYTTDKIMILLLLPIGYYLWSVVGMSYTQSLKVGFSQLEKGISFVLIPVVLFFFKEKLPKSRINTVLISFVYGVTACAVVSLMLGFYRSLHIIDGEVIFRTAVNDVSFARGDSFFEQQTQGGNYFFGEYISPFINTIIYYGIYLSFGVVVALYCKISLLRSRVYIIFSILLFGVLFLCDSRGPFLSFLLSILVVSTTYLNQRLGRILIPVAILGISILLWASPRTSLLIKDFNTIRSKIDFNTSESTALRIVIWNAAFEVLKDNWLFGVGTGDAESSLLAKTKSMNQAAYEKKLNAHNQYLQTGITHGVIGLGLLVAMLWLLLHNTWRNKDYVGIAFVCIVGFNMLSESILQVFQGIQFFIFFYCLLVVKLEKGDEGSSIV